MEQESVQTSFTCPEAGVATPTRASRFRRSGRVTVTALEQKGLTQYGVKFFAGFINKSDGEPAMKALRSAAAEAPQEVESIGQESPEGDHQVNGNIESTASDALIDEKELALREEEILLDATDATRFRSCVMRLTYFSQDRADLGEPGNCLARSMAKPTPECLRDLTRRSTTGMVQMVGEHVVNRTSNLQRSTGSTVSECECAYS